MGGRKRERGNRPESGVLKADLCFSPRGTHVHRNVGQGTEEGDGAWLQHGLWKDGPGERAIPTDCMMRDSPTVFRGRMLRALEMNLRPQSVFQPSSARADAPIPRASVAVRTRAAALAHDAHDAHRAARCIVAATLARHGLNQG